MLSGLSGYFLGTAMSLNAVLEYSIKNLIVVGGATMRAKAILHIALQYIAIL